MSSTNFEMPIRKDEPGTGINVINLSTRRNQRSIMSDLAFRYVFSPAEDIMLLGLMGHKAISVTKLLRGRLSLLQPVPYIDRDNSDSAMLVNSEIDPRKDPFDMAGKAEYMKTPFAQALQLTESYGANGIRVINSLTGVTPDVATLIEFTLIPHVPNSLGDLIKDLNMNGLKRIAESTYFEPKTKTLAQNVLDEMLIACNAAAEYIRIFIRNSKSEIASRHVPGGKGKPEWDDYDDKIGNQLGLRPPTDEELKSAAERRTADSNENLTNVLVQAIRQAQTPSTAGFSPDQMKAFQQMQEKMVQFEKVLTSHPELIGELKLEESTPLVSPHLEEDGIEIVDLDTDESLMNFKPLATEPVPVTDETSAKGYTPLITESSATPNLEDEVKADISELNIKENKTVLSTLKDIGKRRNKNR